jgi:hypothetical protein
MPGLVTIGEDIESGVPINVGDIERCGGLYLLGRPRTGKSELIISLAIQDMEQGHGLLFIDPHADAIAKLLSRIPRGREKDVILLDPTDKACSFGINLLQCADPTDLLELDNTCGRVLNIFSKIWGNEDGDLGVWLGKILRNSIYLLLENPGYTLVEVPLLLSMDTRFRNFLLQNVKANLFVKDFWYNEFDRLSGRDKTEQVGPALSRLEFLRTNTIVRHIVGQRHSTIDFQDILNNSETQKIVLLRMPTDLSDDVKKLIGTILLSQMLSAAFERAKIPEQKRVIFALYCDEFQNFTTPDFAKLFTQTGKYKIMPTVAHQERLGQFKPLDPNRGATLASPNKILFSLSVHDSQELAPEFAKEPTTTETRLEPEMVISQEPLNDLLRRGHANPRIQELVNKWFRPLQEYIESLRDAIEGVRVERTDLLDKAAIFRDQASLDRTDEQMEGLTQARGMNYSVRHDALKSAMSAIESAMAAHSQAKDQTEQMKADFRRYQRTQRQVRSINRFLTALMEGDITPEPWQEVYANFFIDVLQSCFYVTSLHSKVYPLYLSLRFGDPRIPRSIPAFLALKHWSEQLEAVYMQNRKLVQEEAYRRSLNDYEYMRCLEKLGIRPSSVEERLREDLKKYRESEVTFEIGVPAIQTREGTNLVVLPDLPPRVLRPDEIETIKEICYTELLHDPRTGTKDADELIFVTELDEFCHLLQKPENHIKVPSGQYVEKPVHVRPVHDMTNEMAQELTNLPRFTAYAKVIQENNREQKVIKRKIKTKESPRPSVQLGDLFQFISQIERNAVDFGYVKPRKQIEEEIRRRQERWREGISEEPPPTHY